MSEAESRTLRIGIAGMGGMGKLYLENFKHIAHCRVEAVASRSFPGGQGIRVYPALEDMLSAERLDVVCVCTPTHLHMRHVSAALEKGAHVIAEKPLALCAKEAAALYALAERQGVQLYVAQVVRFAHASQVLRELIEGGQYGRVVDASFARLSPAPTWSKDNWAFDIGKSGLIPFDLHIHDLDFIVSLFGAPREYHMLHSGAEGKTYAECNRFRYEYEGFSVFAEAAWYDAPFPFTTAFRVYFERGLAVCQGDDVIMYAKGREPESFTPAQAAQVETGTQVPRTNMYLDQLSHFLHCAREGVPSDIVKRQDVLTVLEILASMQK